MFTHIRLQNYRSFVDAEVDLAPFTLVVGANGAGKTNLLQAFADVGARLSGGVLDPRPEPHDFPPLQRHLNLPDTDSQIAITSSGGSQLEVHRKWRYLGDPDPRDVVLFRLNPDVISASEPVVPKAHVAADGSGTTQTLDGLKSGDQEAVFDTAERNLITYVPEVEKLSFITTKPGYRQIQLRQRGVERTIIANQLSEGTRLIIALLAIIHQPVKPPVVCLEDIDRGMHPRVFQQMAELMGRIAREQDVQIIATTHNPYLVDCFQDEPEAVVIVEKKDGASTLSTLAQKLEGLDYDKIDPADMPLGNLWFSGLVGGVPDFRRPAVR